MVKVGTRGEAALRVTTENTARAMGSDELKVLATPAVAALVEKACWQSVADQLPAECGTVGTRLELYHTAPTPVGMVVRCECEVTAAEDRRLTFTARVYDEKGEVAHADHERFIVDNDRFQTRADRKLVP